MCAHDPTLLAHIWNRLSGGFFIILKVLNPMKTPLWAWWVGLTIKSTWGRGIHGKERDISRKPAAALATFARLEVCVSLKQNKAFVWRSKRETEREGGRWQGLQDCHVCINRHWFFCPALPPLPFILRFVVAPRGAKKFCYSPLTPEANVRIDFSSKRGSVYLIWGRGLVTSSR